MKKVIIKIFFKIFNLIFLLLKIENFNYININIIFRQAIMKILIII